MTCGELIDPEPGSNAFVHPSPLLSKSEDKRPWSTGYMDGVGFLMLHVLDIVVRALSA